jgi:hypothetical protein
MGSATAPDPANDKLGSFGEEFRDSLDKALRHFSGHERDSIQKYVEIEEFHYNDKFELIRNKMADRAKDVRTRLDAVQQLFPGGSFLERFVDKFSSWEQNYGKDEFLYTHWLDVLFYTTYIGGWVRAELAEKLAGLIKEHGSKNVHVIAHSLGTAVLHDTLAQVYPRGGQPIPGTPAWFSVENDQLQSVWMVSNVSNLINTVVGLADPLAPGSTVKPGHGGCTKRFYNVRHELDPFTLVRRFKPKNDGNWISFDNFKLRYRDIKNDVILDPNTHSFSQYIYDPNVSLPMLRKLMGSSKFSPGKTERNKFIENHASEGLTGAFNRLEEAFSNIEVSDLDTLDEFLKAGEAFKTIILEMKKELEGES